MKLLSMFVAAALALSFVGEAQGAEAKKERKPAAGAAEAKKERKQAAGAALQGTVASVDAGGNVKVTKKVAKKDAGGAAQEATVATDANTVVTIDGKAGKIADLTAGMMIRVTPTTGKAEKIEARSAAGKRAGKAAPTPEEKAKRQAERKAKKQAK